MHLYTGRASIINYLRLPPEGVPASPWEDQSDLQHGISLGRSQRTSRKNLLVVLEEWFPGGRWVTWTYV